MQNLWIFYSIAGLTALGFGDYIKKLVLSRGAEKEVFLLVCFLLYVPFFIGNMLFQGDRFFDNITLSSGLIIGVLNFFIPMGMLVALKYLNVSFALVSIRIISSFAILFVGIFLLGDQLSLYNIFGFFLGALAIFLLSGFRFGQKNTFHIKGVIGLIVCTICIILSNSYFKYVLPELNIHDYMAVQFFVTFLCIILYMVIRKKFHLFTMQEFKLVLPYACVTLVIFSLHFLYFLPNIYLLGPLSLGYKMLSYSLLVPIILSVIFLGEPISKIRIFAFALTILSIFLFLL